MKKDFKLAMLGKQGWKLSTNPDAMVPKVLKAKYYQNGGFLDASSRAQSKIYLA